ncbi:trimethylamine methyltransferase family protein [Aestuariispira insulae]|uniref:Trimethylamine--corrinoid protein Co-methyltransferase n=1 Tax=Aestuariispira insulae TaxID=1461337 RepID=A0A3D9HMP8_9PROT|nr:trimethylamine methyltransferase family protein [Aestuariispira insulae]RED50739.1 trimethylamine--corrinoid protein Co-methyltransferase [Aestuariispira insulae]
MQQTPVWRVIVAALSDLQLRAFPEPLAGTVSVPVLSQDQLAAIEADADKILAEIGIAFRDDPESLALLDGMGAKIDGDIARMDGAALRRVISSAPSSFAIKSRNPDRDLMVGTGKRVFVPSYGTPNVRHLDGSYGLGSLADYHMLVRLAHDMPIINHTGTLLCFPHDLSEGHRPLEVVAAHLKLSDKPFMGSVLTPDGCADAIDLTAAVVGDDEMDRHCYLMHLINSNPPLVYVEKALKTLRTAAIRNQGCLVTAYAMMGASSSVSLMGTLAQLYAEVMAGAALSQLVRPGAPVIGGIYAIPFSMRSMIPVFGDPVAALAQMAGCQLVRRLGLPTRGEGGITSSNTFDGQAAAESAFNMTASFHAGADFILHSVGWLENGRTISIDKFERESDWLSTVIGHPDHSEKPPVPLTQSQEQSLSALLKELRHRRSE